MRFLLIGVLAVGVLIAPSVVSALIIDVPSQAYPTIQAGIDGASAGDTVLVAYGTYTWAGEGTGNSQGLIRMKSGVCLMSPFPHASSVIIDAQQQGRVIYGSNLDDTTRIQGITLKNGVADNGGGVYCIESEHVMFLVKILDCVAEQNGGGMFCGNHSSPTMNHVEFEHNFAFDGGGLYCDDYSSPVLENDCTFTFNEAGPVSLGGRGGGMFCGNHSSPTMLDCFFGWNRADAGGGLCCRWTSSPQLTSCWFHCNQAINGIYGYGGGICCVENSSMVLDQCQVRNNSAAASGGGLVSYASSPQLSYCRFDSNSTGNLDGAGIYFESSSPIVEWCVFEENISGRHGGGIAFNQSSPTLTYCTFDKNEADGWGGGADCQTWSSPTFTNCTFTYNKARPSQGGGVGVGTSCYPQLQSCLIAFSVQGGSVYCRPSCSGSTCDAYPTCCNIYGNTGGDWVDCIASFRGDSGNFSEDPLFCEGCYYLQECSPCVEGYGCGLVGAYGIGCPCGGGPSATVPTTWGTIKCLFR